MTWDEFSNIELNSQLTGQIKTDIECPQCGKHIYYDSSIILTSYPAKYRYWCTCGWSDSAPVKWN